MEESLKQLWSAFTWFATLSSTVTITLFSLLLGINKKIVLSDSIHKDLDRIIRDVDEIKIALKGDYEKKGLVTRHYELESRVDKIEESVK